METKHTPIHGSDAYIERFHGMGRAQIRSVVEIDCWLDGQANWDGFEKMVPQLSRRLMKAGVKNAKAFFVYHALQATSNGATAIAERWYEAIDRIFNDSTYLRRQFVEHGEFNAAFKRFGSDLTDTECRSMARLHIDAISSSKDAIWSGPSLTEAINASIAGHDPATLGSLRELAISYGHAEIVEFLSETLQVKIRRKERGVLARAWLNRSLPGDVALLAYIRKHRLSRVGMLHLNNLIEKHRGYHEVREVADRMGIVLTKRQLMQILTHHRLVYDEKDLDLLDELVKRDARLRRKLLGMMARERDQAVTLGRYSLAAELGKRCGRPLEIGELKLAIPKLEQESRRTEFALTQESAKKELSFILDLLAERIHEHILRRT